MKIKGEVKKKINEYLWQEETQNVNQTGCSKRDV